MTLDASIFNTYNNFIADYLERKCLLVFPEKKEECPNCYLDTMTLRSVNTYKVGGPQPFISGMPCPYCNGTGFKSIETTQLIPARIYYDFKTFHKIGVDLNLPAGSIQIITKMLYLAHIEIAKYLIPKYDTIESSMTNKYQRVGKSYPQGFRDNHTKYVISYWSLLT